jgi:hypothetical protein
VAWVEDYVKAGVTSPGERSWRTHAGVDRDQGRLRPFIVRTEASSMESMVDKFADDWCSPVERSR